MAGSRDVREGINGGTHFLASASSSALRVGESILKLSESLSALSKEYKKSGFTTIGRGYDQAVSYDQNLQNQLDQKAGNTAQQDNTNNFRPR